MKAIVALTCAVVIGGIGYFILNDRLDRRAAAELAKARDDYRLCQSESALSIHGFEQICLDWAREGRFNDL